MRKLVSLLFIFLFLASMVTPAFGTSYSEKALDFLIEKYGVGKENIELYEGGLTELEFTAESFWFAKYIISLDGKSTSGFSGGEKPMPLPAPEPVPAPDSPADNRTMILPLPPEDVIKEDYTYNDDYIYGGIYIRIKTGEILELEQMETYFSAEWQLAEKEWERLSKEAGKLDVSLYRKIQGLSATEILTVWIQPTPVETDDLRAQFAALKKKYPEHSVGMELADTLSYGYGYGEFRGDATIDYGVSDNQTEPALSLEKPGTEIMPNRPNEEYWQEYNAFWGELEQIRAQAVIPSLVSIKKNLDGIGITYRENGTAVAADLTVAQIHDFAQLSAVAAIFEEVIFTTMDGAELLSLRSSAPIVVKDMLMEADENESTSSYLPLILIAVAVFAAALVVYRHWIIRTR